MEAIKFLREKYKITPPDQSMYDAVKANWDGVAKPLDGLGWFEHVTSQIGAIEDSTNVCISKRAVMLIMVLLRKASVSQGRKLRLPLHSQWEGVNRAFAVWHQHHIQMLFQ